MEGKESESGDDVAVDHLAGDLAVLLRRLVVVREERDRRCGHIGVGKLDQREITEWNTLSPNAS